MGSVNSISSCMAMKSLHHWAMLYRTGPGLLGWAGWALHGVNEESGQSFGSPTGLKIRMGSLTGADEALGGAGRVTARGQALEARGPRPIYTPLTSANCAPFAKPQSPHLPSGAKTFVFPARASHRRSTGSLNCSL